MELFESGVKKGAVISSDQLYRYRLWRIWNDSLKKLLFIMLNPSTADADLDDPTIRRCIGFAVDLGYGGLEVVNLYGFRATDPKDMLRAVDPIGERNDEFIAAARAECDIAIAAWGALGGLSRGKAVFDLLKKSGPVYCLRTTIAGMPSHPLYLPASLKPVEFKYQRAMA